MWRLIPLALVQSIFLSGGQLLLKKALDVAGKAEWSWVFVRAQLTNWWFLGCGLSFAIATGLWFYILRHYPFSVAYPLSCISYAIGVGAAILFFHEHVTWAQWLGVILIMAGCALIVKQ